MLVQHCFRKGYCYINGRTGQQHVTDRVYAATTSNGSCTGDKKVVQAPDLPGNVTGQ